MKHNMSAGIISINSETSVVQFGQDSVERLVDDIVLRGESTKKVVETMAIMASGKAELAGPVTLNDLFALEESVLNSAISLGDKVIDELTTHLFSNGIYIRKMFIPKNCLLTGAIHKTAHFCVMAAGDISILTVNGLKRFRAPHVVDSPSGVKRIGFAHEDTVWMDVHPNPTNERDPDKLWDMFYHNVKPE